MNYLTSHSRLSLCLPRLQDQGTLSREAQVGMGRCVSGGARGSAGQKSHNPKSHNPKSHTGPGSCRCPLSSHVPCPAVPIAACPSSKAQKTRCEQLVKHLEWPSAKAGHHCPTRAGHTGAAQPAGPLSWQNPKFMSTPALGAAPQLFGKLRERWGSPG